jgi:hypothetical protein
VCCGEDEGESGNQEDFSNTFYSMTVGAGRERGKGMKRKTRTFVSDRALEQVAARSREHDRLSGGELGCGRFWQIARVEFGGGGGARFK